MEIKSERLCIDRKDYSYKIINKIHFCIVRFGVLKLKKYVKHSLANFVL